MVLLVAYQHNNPQKDYSAFFSAIKSNSNRWWHYLPDVWIVETTRYSADAFAKLLYPHFESTDYLLVVRIMHSHQGWLPKEAWDWLNQVRY